MIDWDSILSKLSNMPGMDITTDPALWDLTNPAYEEIFKQWTNANFNLATIKWTNYYPGIHYDSSIADDLGLTVHRSWISRIDPGYMAPWHWDVDDNEAEYLKHGPIIRYTIIPKKFANGHIFILGDEYHFNLTKNAVIEWSDHRQWHSGINAGLEPNWMFHVLGYRS